MVFLVFSLIAKNAAQKGAFLKAISRLTSTSQNWYTCPAGKKAKVQGYVIPDAFGAGTEINIELTNTGQILSEALSVVDVKSPNYTFSLVAGDVLGYDQDAGTNASVDGIWTIEESPA